MRLLALTPIDVPPTTRWRGGRRATTRSPPTASGRGPACPTRPAVRAGLGPPTTWRVRRGAAWRRTPPRPAGWDGFLPDCVLDPAVARGRRRCRVRSTASAGWRCTPSPAPGCPGAAVARNEPIAHELDRLAARYGVATDGPTRGAGRCRVEDIADDVGWAERAGRRRGRPAPATRCSTAARRSTSAAPPSGPDVVDPTALALRVLAAGVGRRAPRERARRPRPRRRRGRGWPRRAPCAAAQLGLDVLVLERQEHFAAGNNTAMSTAMVPGAGSRWQREAGHRGLARPVPRRHPGQDRRRRRRADRPRPGRRERAGWWSGSPTTSASTSSLVTDFSYPGPLGAALPHRAGPVRAARCSTTWSAGSAARTGST